MVENNKFENIKMKDAIDRLDVMADNCNQGSLLELYKTQSDLYFISDKKFISLSEFREYSRRLEAICKKFKDNCLCWHGPGRL